MYVCIFVFIALFTYDFNTGSISKNSCIFDDLKCLMKHIDS